jgi:hypothetical protein
LKSNKICLVLHLKFKKVLFLDHQYNIYFILLLPVKIDLWIIKFVNFHFNKRNIVTRNKLKKGNAQPHFLKTFFQFRQRKFRKKNVSHVLGCRMKAELVVTPVEKTLKCFFISMISKEWKGLRNEKSIGLKQFYTMCVQHFSDSQNVNEMEQTKEMLKALKVSDLLFNFSEIWQIEVENVKMKWLEKFCVDLHRNVTREILISKPLAPSTENCLLWRPTQNLWQKLSNCKCRFDKIVIEICA